MGWHHRLLILNSSLLFDFLLSGWVVFSRTWWRPDYKLSFRVFAIFFLGPKSTINLCLGGQKNLFEKKVSGTSKNFLFWNHWKKVIMICMVLSQGQKWHVLHRKIKIISQILKKRKAPGKWRSELRSEKKPQVQKSSRRALKNPVKSQKKTGPIFFTAFLSPVDERSLFKKRNDTPAALTAVLAFVVLLLTTGRI